MTTDPTSLQDYGAGTDELAYDTADLAYDNPELTIERGMNFADGFQFGCGFWAAGLIALVLAILAILLLSFVLSFVGVSLLF